MRVGVRTDIGRLRELNEDSYFVGQGLYAVADGMGGHDAGEVASAIAVETLNEMGVDGSDPMGSLERVVVEINRRIYERSRLDGSCAGMGTTLTILFTRGSRAYIAHVGDSRAYLARGDGLKQVTEDHSVVGELLRRGGITEVEARFHPQRNVITRALGVFPLVKPDLLPLDILEGDTFLLCTDGLTNMLEDREIGEVLAKFDEPQIAADLLVEMANARGGFDNITVLVVKVEL